MSKYIIKSLELNLAHSTCSLTVGYYYYINLFNLNRNL